MAPPVLDENHHTFLQSVMTRGPLSEKSTMAIYKSLVGRSNGDGFGEFFLKINKELEYIQLELKKVMNQYDGKVFYGIINSLPSKEAKLGTQFSQTQIILFTAVVEAIVQDPSASGVISSMAAMNLKLEAQAPTSETQDANAHTGPVKMNMAAKEEALGQLVAEQYLSRTESGGVVLGVKSFLELRSVFRNLEVPFCDICNEAAIKAQLCNTRDCLKRVHVYCVARGSSQARAQKPKCNGCQTVWVQEVEEEQIGTPEATEEEFTVPIATQDDPEQMSRPRTRTSRRKRSTAALDDEEAEHTEANGHVPEEPETRTRTASRRTRSAAVLDDEVEEHTEANGHVSEEPEVRTRTSRRKRSAAIDDDEDEEHTEAIGHESEEELDVRSTRSGRTSKRPRR